MGTAALISGALSGIAGLFGGTKSTSTTNYNSSTSPNYDPANLAFRNSLINQFNSLTSPQSEANFGKAYTTTGLNNIIAGSQQTSQSVNDALASRGLDRTTAGAGALLDTSNLEAQNAANFQNQATLDLSNRDTQNLQAAAGYQASLPVGVNTSGTQTTTGTVGPSSPLGGFLGGLSQSLSATLGQQSAANSLGNLLKQYAPQQQQQTASPSSQSLDLYSNPGGVTTNTDSEGNTTQSFGGGWG